MKPPKRITVRFYMDNGNPDAVVLAFIEDRGWAEDAHVYQLVPKRKRKAARK